MCNSTDTKVDTYARPSDFSDGPAEPDRSLPSDNYGDNDMEKFQFSPVQHMILERSPVPFGIYQYINQKIAERLNAKKEKDYALADSIRNELLEKGIVLKDTPNGTEFEIK